ncbi:hypothetical protein D9615_008314 [Tricholomella constricta]|uniref:Uncharacterized protein n=1 Tax=Tricholomella constricta TaxID=117010 RepID=A0A8H5HDI5_9AGAR|nr:hypothetical protein D9615_008314 [Tricholomella constricta]
MAGRRRQLIVPPLWAGTTSRNPNDPELPNALPGRLGCIIAPYAYVVSLKLATSNLFSRVPGAARNAGASGSQSAYYLEREWFPDLQVGSGIFAPPQTPLCGGFNNRFSIPEYQKQAVKGHLALSKLRKSDPAARSLLAAASGAVPTVASLIPLVNDARLAAGKEPVGFIRPTELIKAARTVSDTALLLHGWLTILLECKVKTAKDEILLRMSHVQAGILHKGRRKIA